MATIQAKILKVEHDVGTGWYTILTDDDSVKKMTTKMEQKAREAAALRQSGELLEITFSQKEGTNTNPHTGKPYVNTYYERAEVARVSTNGASADDSGIDTVGAPEQQDAGSGGRSWNEDPLRAWRISLAAGAKLAVATLPLMPVEQRDFDTQKRIAMAWGVWLFTTPPPSSETPTPTPASSHGAYSEPVAAAAHPDDDIPF